MVKAQKGQTLIETALILFLLLLILLGISEFARAWYTKNALKNAVRHGARIAVVTPGIVTDSDDCSGNACPSTPANNTDIRNCVCSSPGVRNNADTTVSIEITGDNGNGTADTGETIRVSGTTIFTYVVGGSPWPWPDSTNLITDASMRYE